MIFVSSIALRPLRAAVFLSVSLPLGIQASDEGKGSAATVQRKGIGSLLARAKEFTPKRLSPAWQLDASRDFRKLANGTPVSRWRGAKFSSFVQEDSQKRPMYRDGALHFDGVNDYLSFPFWKRGVGTQWTVAVLMKVPEGIPDYRVLFGPDGGEPRVLEFTYGYEGLIAQIPTYSWVVPTDHSALVPSDNWRTLIVRSDGARVTTQLDWYKNETPIVSRTLASKDRKFNLGCSSDPGKTAPLSLRYMAYFPRCLSDAETDKMTQWLEDKKQGEHPPVALFYGGGQSNFLGCRQPLRRDLAAAFGNTAFAFGHVYGGTPLANWMRDTDDASGYEVCPLYDVSAAPMNSRAATQQNVHSGTKVMERWDLMARSVEKHPKSLSACIFIQGESDTEDARFRWKPNGLGFYNLSFADPHALADSYGPRSNAWNAAIRDRTGLQGMFFIYQRVNFSPGTPVPAIQAENILRQRKSQLDALADDPRYFLVDTEDYPRPDNVHFSDPLYQRDQIPNTGVERFNRSAIRLLKAGESLSALEYNARMIAMRAIDAGFEMDAGDIAACAQFAESPSFAQLRSLVIPALPAGNAADRSRLARCNLVQHLGDRNEAGFLPQAPAVCTATCLSGADTEALSASISDLLAAWGVPGAVSLETRPE
jgi:hypothetical protein